MKPAPWTLVKMLDISYSRLQSHCITTIFSRKESSPGVRLGYQKNNGSPSAKGRVGRFIGVKLKVLATERVGRISIDMGRELRQLVENLRDVLGEMERETEIKSMRCHCQ